MSSIIESDAKVRDLLDYPKPQRPPVHQRHSAIVRNVQHLYNTLSNTNEAWAVGETILDVDASSDVISLGKDKRIGKILLISTYSPRRDAIERAVDFFDVQNMNFDWNAPKNYGSNGWFDYCTGGAHTAERMAVFYDAAGELSLQIRPTPNRFAQYRVQYSIGNWTEKIKRESSPILSQFHDIFEIRSAKDLLYTCEWEGLDKKENIERRKEIRPSLDEMEARFLPDFNAYVREMTQPRMTFKKSLF